jgi:hypothetical protein
VAIRWQTSAEEGSNAAKERSDNWQICELNQTGVPPKLLTTDKLGSYGSAFRHLHLTCRHEQGLRKN